MVALDSPLRIDEILGNFAKGFQSQEQFDPFSFLEPSEISVLDPVERIEDPLPQRTELIGDVETREFDSPSAIEFEITKMPNADVRAYQQHGKDLPGFKAGRWMKIYDNGEIPLDAMVEVEGFGYMRPDAARAMKAMKRAARKDGIELGGGAYRSYAEQVALKKEKPTLAATPGTSNHGWGMAVDFLNADYSTETYQWLAKHGAKYGWVNPDWAVQGGSKEEPWHWEFQGGYKGGKVRAVSTKPHDHKHGGTHRSTQQAPKGATDIVSSVDPLVSLPMSFGSVIAQARLPKVLEGQEHKRADVDDHYTSGGLGFAPRKMRNLFIEAGEKYGIDPRLLAYVAKHESGFDRNATSSAGAKGVMQVMDSWGLKNPFNAKENIFKGAEILASYLNLAKGDMKLALAFYNAGPNADPDLIQARIEEYAMPIIREWRNQ